MHFVSGLEHGERHSVLLSVVAGQVWRLVFLRGAWPCDEGTHALVLSGFYRVQGHGEHDHECEFGTDLHFLESPDVVAFEAEADIEPAVNALNGGAVLIRVPPDHAVVGKRREYPAVCLQGYAHDAAMSGLASLVAQVLLGAGNAAGLGRTTVLEGHAGAISGTPYLSALSRRLLTPRRAAPSLR